MIIHHTHVQQEQCEPINQASSVSRAVGVMLLIRRVIFHHEHLSTEIADHLIIGQQRRISALSVVVRRLHSFGDRPNASFVILLAVR